MTTTIVVGFHDDVLPVPDGFECVMSQGVELGVVLPGISSTQAVRFRPSRGQISGRWLDLLDRDLLVSQRDFADLIRETPQELLCLGAREHLCLLAVESLRGHLNRFVAEDLVENLFFGDRWLERNCHIFLPLLFCQHQVGKSVYATKFKYVRGLLTHWRNPPSFLSAGFHCTTQNTKGQRFCG